jgi:hypothetical protein
MNMSTAEAVNDVLSSDFNSRLKMEGSNPNLTHVRSPAEPGINDVSMSVLMFKQDLDLDNTFLDLSESESDSETEVPSLEPASAEFDAKLDALLEFYASKIQAAVAKSAQTGAAFLSFQEKERKEREAAAAEKLRGLDSRLNELRAEDREAMTQLQALEDELEELKTNKTPEWRKAKENFTKTTTQLGTTLYYIILIIVYNTREFRIFLDRGFDIFRISSF